MKERQRQPQDLAMMWQAYFDSRMAFGQELRRVLAVQKGIPNWKGTRVLDVGCGDARIAQAFSGDGAQVAALEVGFDRMVRVARRLAANPEEPALLLLMGDGAGLPFPDDVFDLVILSDVIEHAKDPEGVVQEVSRVLRPGGMLYASMPNRFSIVNLLSDPHYNVPAVGLLPRRVAAFCVTKLLRISDTYTVEGYFSHRQVVQLLRNAGLTVKELKGRYEEKIRCQEKPKAPSRRWMMRMLEVRGMRRLVLYLASGRFFKHFVQWSWEFAALKPNGPAPDDRVGDRLEAK